MVEVVLLRPEGIKSEWIVQAVAGWGVTFGYCKVVESAQLRYIPIWRHMHSTRN